MHKHMQSDMQPVMQMHRFAMLRTNGRTYVHAKHYAKIGFCLVTRTEKPVDNWDSRGVITS